MHKQILWRYLVVFVKYWAVWGLLRHREKRILAGKIKGKRGNRA